MIKLNNSKTCVKLPLSKRPKIGFQDQLLLNADQKYCSNSCVKLPLSKRPNIGFQDQLSLNAGQKYCRMLPSGAFIKLPIVIKVLVLSIFEWPFTQVLL